MANHDAEELSNFDLVIAGRKIDGRTVDARRFRSIAGDLQVQLGRDPFASERMLIINAATLAMLCERDCAALLEGSAIDQDNFRKNAQLLSGLLIKLGMAKKSRDIAKRDLNVPDPFGQALIEANTA